MGVTVSSSGSLEIRGPADALLDEPLQLNARGAGPDAEVKWQARYLDDDARVWRATATRSGDLLHTFTAAKAGTGPVAVLASLRPVSLEVRAQAADGRAATRTLVRRFLDDGVRARRWRDGLAATLHLPAGDPPPCATVLLDATAGPAAAHVATLAAPLLASRGVLVLSVSPARGDRGAGELLATARERLAAVPTAGSEVVTLRAVDPRADPEPGLDPATTVVLPPGVGARDASPAAASARAVAWDALIARLGARPRTA